MRFFRTQLTRIKLMQWVPLGGALLRPPQQRLLFLVFCGLWFPCSVRAKPPEAPPSPWQVGGWLDAGGRLTLYGDPQQPAQGSALLNQVGLKATYKPSDWLQFNAILQIAMETVTLPKNPWFLLDEITQVMNVTANLPIAPNWSIYAQLGRFFAPYGWDSLNTPGRIQATISFPMLMTPNTLTGLKLGLRGPWLEFFFFATNEPEAVVSSVLQPNLGAALTLSLGAFVWNLSFLHGASPPYTAAAYRNDPVTLLNSNLQLSLWNGRFQAVIEGAFVFHPSGRFYYLTQGILHGMFLPWLGLTTRYSRHGDPDGLYSAVSAYDEWSIAILSRFPHDFSLLAEYRLDRRNEQLYTHTIQIKSILAF